MTKVLFYFTLFISTGVFQVKRCIALVKKFNKMDILFAGDINSFSFALYRYDLCLQINLYFVLW